MRRFTTLTLAFSCLTLVGCSQPPKPEKADPASLEKIQPSGEDTKPGTANKDLGGIPDPVANVGEKLVTAADFRGIYDLKIKKYEDRGREIPQSADRRYRKSITDRLIYQEVLRQESAALGVTHDATKLSEREEQQRRGIRDWEKHLERRGETEDSLRQMYIAELLERALLEKSGVLEVKPEEIDAEYEKVKPNYKSDKERVHAAHILIPVGPEERMRPRPGEKPEEPSDDEKKKWKAEAFKKAEGIFAQATAPDADFTALAKEHSVGPSANRGGDLGVFTKDRMVEEFSAAAFKLKPNEVSKPVETKFGIHIIKSLGKYAPGDLPKEALVDTLQQRLSQRKLHQGRRDMKEKLLEKYAVKNHMTDALGPDPRRSKRKPRGAKGKKQPVNPHGANPHAAKPHSPHGGAAHGAGTPPPPPPGQNPTGPGPKPGAKKGAAPASKPAKPAPGKSKGKSAKPAGSNPPGPDAPAPSM